MSSAATPVKEVNSRVYVGAYGEMFVISLPPHAVRKGGVRGGLQAWVGGGGAWGEKRLGSSNVILPNRSDRPAKPS